MADASSPENRLQLWGGVECTVNRVHDTFFSQLERNGHAARTRDIDRAAGLGISQPPFPNGPQGGMYATAEYSVERMRD